MGGEQFPLDREGFLKRIVTKDVPLPDGSLVCIRALPASLIVSGAENSSETFATANMLVQSLCDEHGNLLFGDGEDEKDQAMTVDHLSLKIILDAIVDLNGLRPPKEGEEGEPEKN